MIVCIDAEKAMDKIQYPFLIKALKKLGKGRKGLSLIIIKVMYNRPITLYRMGEN
jgi:hypothetical protein